MAASLGFVGKHLICMQGPFSRELNTAMLRQFEAAYLVTKDSGKVEALRKNFFLHGKREPKSS